MSADELKSAKDSLQIQMWYWRDRWSAENLSDMPDYIKHMYYLYGYVLWMQKRVDKLERLYKIINSRDSVSDTSYIGRDTEISGGLEDGVIDTPDDGDDVDNALRDAGTVVVSGGTVSVIEPSAELLDREVDTKVVGERRENRDGL